MVRTEAYFRDLFILFCLVFIVSAFLAVGQSSDLLKFVMPIKVLHGSDTVEFNNIGEIYFGSDTNYEQRKVKRYISEAFYDSDAKENDYRLIANTDPVLCHAVVEVPDLSRQYKVGSDSFYTRYIAEISLFDSNNPESEFVPIAKHGGICSYQSYLDKETQRACSQKVNLPNDVKEYYTNLGLSQNGWTDNDYKQAIRGKRFKCTITVKHIDENNEIVAEKISEPSKDLVVADVNYHVTAINDNDYGNILDQYEYFVYISDVRTEETLDDLNSKEALGKLIFHEPINIDLRTAVKYIPFSDLGYEPQKNTINTKGTCLTTDEHLQEVKDKVGIKDDDINKKKGDVIVAVSDPLLTQIVACTLLGENPNEPVYINTEDIPRGHSVMGKHYLITQKLPVGNALALLKRGARYFLDVNQKETTRTLAHEMGHALEFYDESENLIASPCDENNKDLWGFSDLMRKRGLYGQVYPNGCPNPFPACCTAKGGYKCATPELDILGRPIGDNHICFGMPIGYENYNEQQFKTIFKVTPDMEFSIMGKGSTYPQWFRSPLPKKN